MNEDFNIKYEKWKNKDLLTWIKDYEKKFYENNNLNEDRKEIIEEIYKGSEDVRNNFYEHYITDISENLNTRSNKNTYQYLNFFKRVEPKGNKNIYEIYKKEEIKYYDDDNDKNNINKRIIKEEYRKKYKRPKYGKHEYEEEANNNNNYNVYRSPYNEDFKDEIKNVFKMQDVRFGKDNYKQKQYKPE